MQYDQEVCDAKRESAGTERKRRRTAPRARAPTTGRQEVERTIQERGGSDDAGRSVGGILCRVQAPRGTQAPRNVGPGVGDARTIRGFPRGTPAVFM